MRHFELAIFDLDNTLYDWYSAFIPAFYGMVDKAASLLDANRETLLDELKAVHVKHHDVEHPFSLIETPTVRALIETKGIEASWALLDPAFYEFNKLRKERLALFPDVRDTLTELVRRGIKIVAYTDSKYFAAIGRVERLLLGDIFYRIYCREKGVSELPKRQFPQGAPILAKVSELPANELKPNPTVLVDIAGRENTPLGLTCYVGDSLAKDVLMARQAGCFAIWAKYGSFANDKMYSDLIRISHWTDEDISREREYARKAEYVRADLVLEDSIAEMLPIIAGPAQSKIRA